MKISRPASGMMLDEKASGPERYVGLVQDSAGVHRDQQCEPGMLAIELHRSRGHPVARAGRFRVDPARPGSAICNCRVRRFLSSDPTAGSEASTPESPPLTI